MTKRFNEAYTNRTWAHLLMHYLKEAGNKGMTKDEIKALFPSKSNNAVLAVLYRYGITRKAFKDTITGKCRKRYYLTEHRNWKKQVKKLLRTTKHGLSLTDLLLETGVPKKSLEDYLKKLGSLVNKIETTKIDSRTYPIIRYYMDNREVTLKKDEELYVDKLLKKEKRENFSKERILTLIQIMHDFIKIQGRFSIKEVQDKLMEDKKNISEYYVRNLARKEGFKEYKIYQFKDTNCRHVPHLIFYLDKEVPLKSGEIPQDAFDLFLEKQIIKAIKIMKCPVKSEIQEYVGQAIGQITPDSSYAWSSENVPYGLFNNKMAKLRQQGKIQIHKALNREVTYTL